MFLFFWVIWSAAGVLQETFWVDMKNDADIIIMLVLRDIAYSH